MKILNFLKVVVVKNLSEKVNADMLFRVFGVYGNVQRVKIMFKNRNMALIQFQNHYQGI